MDWENDGGKLLFFAVKFLNLELVKRCVEYDAHLLAPPEKINHLAMRPGIDTDKDFSKKKSLFLVADQRLCVCRKLVFDSCLSRAGPIHTSGGGPH